MCDKKHQQQTVVQCARTVCVCVCVYGREDEGEVASLVVKDQHVVTLVTARFLHTHPHTHTAAVLKMFVRANRRR